MIAKNYPATSKVIHAAWQSHKSAHRWDVQPIFRVPVPPDFYRPPADGPESPANDCYHVVEFRREIDTMNRVPMARVVGRIAEIEVIVTEYPV